LFCDSPLVYGRENKCEKEYAIALDYLETSGEPTDLAYLDPPALYTRMRAVQETVPGALVMDTGSAAILGALIDREASARMDSGLTVMNVGNEYTLAALVKGERIWGLFEHHTSVMPEGALPEYLAAFRAGTLTERRVFDDGGHGCHVVANRPAADYSFTVITGPQRARATSLGRFAAPYGNMMLTACFGLLRAALRHWNLPDVLSVDR
jgi:uncharacterized protein (DUF1786 family)